MKFRINQLEFTSAAFGIVVLAHMFSNGIVPQARAQSGDCEKQYIGQSLAAGSAVVLDASGNVLVTGFADHDAITIKYSNTGIPLWTNGYNGPWDFDDYGSGIAVDGSGNVFVVGTSGVSADNAPILEYVTIKYSAAGVPLWTNRYDSGQDYYSNDFGDPRIAVDSNGNVFVTGTVTNVSELQLRITKYSNDGVGIWTNRFPEAYAKGIKVDSSDNVIVVGYGNGYDGYLTLKYSNAGVALWTNQFSGDSANVSTAFALGMAVDSHDDILVTGAVALTGAYGNYVTLKYSSSGIPLWTNSYDSGAQFGASARAVAVDSSDNVMVTGVVRKSTGSWDYGTIKYSNLGEPLWTNQFAGGYGAMANSIVADPIDNVIVSGAAGTIVYSPAGLVLCTDRSAKTLGDQALAADHSGNVFAAGAFADPFNSYVIVKYSPPPIRMTIISDGSGGYFIRGTSQPNVTYRLQRSSTIIGPWSDISTNTAPASGLVEYHETAPLPNQAFYRALR